MAGNYTTQYFVNGIGLYSVGANLQLADCLVTNNYVIDANSGRQSSGAGLYFDNGTLTATRSHFIKNISSDHLGGGGAIYLGGTTLSATFNNCVFQGNRAGKKSEAPTGQDGYGGAIWANLNALAKTVTLENCTFKDNHNDQGHGGAIYLNLGTLILKNSIFWGNSVGAGFIGDDIYRANGNVLISYSCLPGLAAPTLYGVLSDNLSNVITNDPLFASATDLHLQSPLGRWDPTVGTFITTDTAYSPCIDAGDPASEYDAEPVPNGKRINMGAYGNTAQASQSPAEAPLITDRGVTQGFNYTKAMFSGELVNTAAVIAQVGVCYGTTSVAGDTTNGWDFVSLVPSPQQTGAVFSVTSPYLLTNTTYYYRWFATNAYGSAWTSASPFTSGTTYPPGWGEGGGPDVIHVNKDAVGDRDGRDWFNAFTKISDGYSALSGSRTNIWITGGEYKEGTTLMIATDLTILGGFAGTETFPAERALTDAGVATNYTTLNGESAYKCLGITAGNVQLETLAFSNCNQNRAVSKAGTGTLIMNNCRIVENSGSGATVNGAGNGVGGYFSGGNVLMTNCLVANNKQSGYGNLGFGIYSSGVNLYLVDCLFTNNFGDAWNARSGRGAGLAFDNGTLDVTRTDFLDNGQPGHITGGGGAVYLGNSANMSTTFRNCVFRGNQSGNVDQYYAAVKAYAQPGFGGAIWMNMNAAKTCTVANCTFADNVNDSGDGGAIYVGGGKLVIQNSILWTNAARNGYTGDEIYAINAASSVSNSYVCISGTNAPQIVTASGAVVVWGDGVITNDPLYASATDVHLQSHGGRYDPTTRMFVTTDRVVSPCIDAGDPAADFTYEPMPNGGRMNLGAYGNTAQASKIYRPSGSVIILR